jgi:hypothetical protein
MSTTMKRIFAKARGPILLSALVLPGVASAQHYRPGYPPPASREYGPQGTVDGFITADRGRCLALRDHQRRTFYLSGGTDGLRPGDHVTVRERTMSRSYCGNDGPTLEVLGVRTVWNGGGHRAAYFDARRDGDFVRFLERSHDRGGWYSDRYSYMQQYGGRSDRYGRYGDRDRYAPPNGPNGQYAPPYDQNGPGQPPQYAPNDRYAPNGPGQPPPLQNEPNGQYGPNGQGQPPPPQYDPNGGQYDNQPSDDQNGDDRGAPQSISVDGTLDFNGTCPAVRDRNGTSYDLAGDLRGFHNGERVRVTGLLSGSSSCGGTALEIQEIRERR